MRPNPRILDKHHHNQNNLCMAKDDIGSSPPEFVSAAEAARILGVHHVAVGQMLRADRLRGMKIARNWIIPREVLEEFAKTYVKGPGRRGPRERKGALT